MADITILRAKPNPVGKDKYGSHSPQTQLHAEWVDLYNSSGHALSMVDVKLYDHTFDVFCNDRGKRSIFTFGEFSLPANCVVRIHSGNRIDASQLPLEDRNGADYHGYTGNNYVLNNNCGDILEVRSQNDVLIDKTSYSARPLEGAILVRKGDYLV